MNRVNKIPILSFLLLVTILLSFFFQQDDEAMNMQRSDCPVLTGSVVYPDDSGYEKARLVSNYYTSKEKRPKAIVYCTNTQDIQNAVKWARCNNVPVRVRSGGHHHEGYSTANHVLVIDVSRMKRLDIDKEKKTARAEAGVNNGQLYETLFDHGFTHIGGTCSDVSFAGLVSSGGIGPLLRKEGLTIDSVLSFRIVDAEGKILDVKPDNEYKDLFWAVRGGGGGNFGILSEVEFKIYPAEKITWINIGWDWNDPVEKIIEAWQDFFLKADRRWFSHLDIWSASFPKEKLRKSPIKYLGFFRGTPDEAKRDLKPILSIGIPKVEIREVAWLEAIRQIEESTAVFLTNKPEYKSPGAYVMEKLDPSAIRIISETLKNSPYPLFNVLIFSLGGAAAEVPPDATAYYYRDANFYINYAIQWLEPDQDKEQIQAMDTLYGKLSKYTVGDYIGNPDPNFQDYMQVYYGANAERLRCIKKKYDPDDFFHFEQSIPPSQTCPIEVR